jgi:hypothetical protein
LQNIADAHSQLTFTVSNCRERDASINAAVISLRAAATTARSGILVTRKSPHLFTVAVSQNVPFGLTREVDEAPCSENSVEPALRTWLEATEVRLEALNRRREPKGKK